MTRREQYGLTFSKWKSADGSVTPICRREIVNNYNMLQVIDHLKPGEVESLLEEIEFALNGQPYQDIFDSDSVSGSELIQILPPDIHINTVCVIPLQHMKELLLEWTEFINS